MLRSGVRTFKVKRPPRAARAILLLPVLLVGSCYWSRYDDLMETHLELLQMYAAKLVAVAASGRPLPPQDWAEFVYPLDRAEDFARIAARRYPDRDSLARFREVLERYGDMVADPAVLRREDASETLGRQQAALDGSIVRVRRSLDEER